MKRTNKLSLVGILLISFVDTAYSDTANTAPNLIIENNCAFDLWIQQDSKHSVPNSPDLVFLKKTNGSYTYNIPKAGLSSTRFWPKKNCDSKGINCQIGNSAIVPSLAKYYKKGFMFAPPIDSKFEATWGCYPGEKCNINPANNKSLTNVTWWDGSVVDGYTLPYAILISDKTGNFSSNPVNNVKVYCGNLDPNACPTTSDLSSDGANKIVNKINLTNVDLTWSKNKKPIGCFSPCSKLTTAQGLATVLGVTGPDSKVAVNYCCPTPPISSSQCSNGPAATNSYTVAVKQQRCNSYTYAYDDAASLGVVPVTTKFKVVFCPSSDLEKAITRTKVQFTATSDGLKNLNNSFYNNKNIEENVIYDMAEGDIVIDKSSQYQLKTCAFKLIYNQSLKTYTLNSLPSVGNGEFCDYLTTKYIDGINIVTVNNTKQYINPKSKFTFRVGVPEDMQAFIDNSPIKSGADYNAQNFPSKSTLIVTKGDNKFSCDINFNNDNITKSTDKNSSPFCNQLSIAQLSNSKIEYIGVPDIAASKVAFSNS